MSNSGIKSFFSAVASVYYWIVLILITLITGILTLPFMIFRMRHAMHSSGYLWGRTLCWFAGIRIEAEGIDRLHSDGPVIFISNHQSMVDIIVFFSVLRVPFAWMAKASLFKIPLFGWGMAAAGYIPVERDDRRKALDSLYGAADMVKAGRSVVIFPEGTRGFPDGSMRQFKKGGFILAKRAEVVIQPITIHGASAVMPPKQRGTRIQRISPGKVQMMIHPPIAAAAYADMSPEELSAHVRTIIEEPLARMKARAADAAQ
ncbi:MAG: 1-acyl-sn-glycerol-3-phosphate acyltransferase [bacterium]|nr:1-acyl-sn-glycerol-3-phosphate acyltransferase [bacterium]